MMLVRALPHPAGTCFSEVPTTRAVVSLGNMDDVTQILNAIDAGDEHTAARLLPLVYDELRKLAVFCFSVGLPARAYDEGPEDGTASHQSASYSVAFRQALSLCVDGVRQDADGALLILPAVVAQKRFNSRNFTIGPP